MHVHDWTRVDAGIFHAFHHRWISAISDALNAGILPSTLYALPEQHAAGFGPDVLTLQSAPPDLPDPPRQSATTAVLERPKLAVTAETDMEFYRRKQNAIVVRHVSGDQIVAVIEIVSPGNKSTRHSFRSFVEKAAHFLERGVHVLIVDLFPPGPRDPSGIHAAIWDEIAGQTYTPPPGKPLTIAAYESDLALRTYVRNFAVGDPVPDMPLFLRPGDWVMTPLAQTYQEAFAVQPIRWKRVLEDPAS